MYTNMCRILPDDNDNFTCIPAIVVLYITKTICCFSSGGI